MNVDILQKLGSVVPNVHIRPKLLKDNENRMVTHDNMTSLISVGIFLELNLCQCCLFSGIKVMRLDADDFDEIERIGNA